MSIYTLIDGTSGVAVDVHEPRSYDEARNLKHTPGRQRSEVADGDDSSIPDRQVRPSGRCAASVHQGAA